jgi:fused signal recognition particle receptor
LRNAILQSTPTLPSLDNRSDGKTEACSMKLFKRKSKVSNDSQPLEATSSSEPIPGRISEGEPLEQTSFYVRLKTGLSRTGSQLASGLGDLFLGTKSIDQDLLDALEEHLVMADVGMAATGRIVSDITDRVSRRELSDGDAVMAATKDALNAIISPCEIPLDTASARPYVILVVGVNGAGKTTTIGKLAHRFKGEGKRVMLAAGDTFRAAAVEQLQAWGERNEVPVVAQHTGADSASVLFDAVQSAKAKAVDVLIADTAGRLQNKAHLMDELEKVVRVMRKVDPALPHETLLVLDAGTGQNAVSQAEQFDASVGVTGLVLTKLDGTARGGVIFAIAEKLKRPIRFIGVGEKAEDLQPFVARDFVAALFDRN